MANTRIKVHADARHIPKNANQQEMCLVPGEHKAGLMIWAHEPATTVHEPFEECIKPQKLRSIIK